MKKQWSFRAGVAVLLLALASPACRNAPEPERPKAKPAAAVRKPGPAKISQFYADKGAVERGERVLLCYSVEDARKVSITPAVEGVYPAYSRCIPVTPARTTTYTFSAEGEDGAVVSQDVTVTVGGAAGGPGGFSIRYFNARKGDNVTLLCYWVDHGEAVEVSPNVLPRTTATNGCVGVAPREATTYTLKAYGPGGKALERTVTVNPQ